MEAVVITGANRGIGLELVKQFHAANYHVIATCRNPADATELSNLASSSEISVHQLDVTNADSVQGFVEAMKNISIDVLINNAGVIGGDHQSLDDMDYSAWSDTLEVNTVAPFRLISLLRYKLSESKRPRAITISSQMGSLNRTSAGSYAYRSSKAALNKVMQVLALELKDNGIIVCPIHPGWVRTDMGGENADISVEESGAGLFKLIDSMTMEHSGRFWKWDGEEHPW